MILFSSMKYSFLTFLFLGISLLPATASADMLPDNAHGVTSCVWINNLASFPDYTFILAGSYRYASAEKVEARELCGLAGDREVLAIKNVNLNKIQHNYQGEDEGNWPQDPANAPYIIRSGVQLSFGGSYLLDTDPTREIHQVVHIDGVSSTTLRVHVAKITKMDQNGVIRIEYLSLPSSTSTATSSTSSTNQEVLPIRVMSQASTDPVVPVVPAAPSSVQPMIVYRDSTNYYLIVVVTILGLLGLGLMTRAWKK